MTAMWAPRGSNPAVLSKSGSDATTGLSLQKQGIFRVQAVAFQLQRKHRRVQSLSGCRPMAASWGPLLHGLE